jgi:hypothetical protein
MKKLLILITVVLASQLLEATDTMVFKGYTAQAKYAGDTLYPVVGIGERKPLILKDGEVLETDQGWIQLKEHKKISDMSLEIASVDERWNEKALVLRMDVQSSEPMQNVYALLVYELPGKSLPRCKYEKLPTLTGESQPLRLRFNTNNLPEGTGWSLHFYRGQQELYTNRSEDMREATPKEAFNLKLARHLAMVGNGDANPAPFYMPISKADESILPDGKPVTVKVKLTIKKDGRADNISFPDPVSPSLENHITANVREWLFFPRISNGKAVNQSAVLPIQL